MTDYTFATLSPIDFEILVCDLLRTKEKLEFKAFDHGPDGGIDLIAPLPGHAGDFVVQCKHYKDSSFRDLLRAAKAEKPKMDEIRPSEYLFVTSQRLTYNQQIRLAEALHPWTTGVESIAARRDLNTWLNENAPVEKRNFKLWLASSAVLEKIMEKGIWARSEVHMEEIQDRVQRFVANANFGRAQKTLAEQNVCVLIGSPGVGKSMTAEMLALTHWDSGWQVVSLDSHEISRCWDVWDPDEKQFFLFDDVFGQTDISESLGRESGKVVSRLIRSVATRRNKRLVITSRTHILRDAQERDEDVQRARLTPQECIVQLSDYSLLQKAQILSNHLYFSAVDRNTVRQFARRKQYRDLVSHANFTPRIIEQTILQYQSEQTNNTLRDTIYLALQKPVMLWETSFKHSLTEASRQLLHLLITYPVSGGEVSEIKGSMESRIETREITRAFKQLEGSWIRIRQDRDTRRLIVQFNDPSCRDFILALIDQEPNLVLPILRATVRVESITIVLGYAFSSGSTEAKCPNIKSIVENNVDEIAELIRIRWSQIENTTAEDVLARLAPLWDLCVKTQIGLEQWILDRFVSLLPRLDPARTDPRDALALLSAWRTRLPFPPDSHQSRIMSDIVDQILGTLQAGDISEWIELHETLEWAAQGLDDAALSAARSIFQTIYLPWIETELDFVLSNSVDRMSAEDWIARLKLATDNFLGDGTFDHRFSDIHSALARHIFYDDFSSEDHDLDEDDEEEPLAAQIQGMVLRAGSGEPAPSAQLEGVFQVLE